MAKNFIQPGSTLTIVAGGSITSGAPIVVGDLVGVALNSATIGQPVDLRLDGVFRVAKLGTDTIDQGQLVYWDAGNARVTETASTHKAIGHAFEAAGNGVATVAVKLLG